MQLENGQQIQVVADLDGERMYPSLFFVHFSNVPRFATYDLVLDTLVEETITPNDLVDGLLGGVDKFSEEFTTA